MHTFLDEARIYVRGATVGRARCTSTVRNTCRWAARTVETAVTVVISCSAPTGAEYVVSV
jgi:hypothetical protein